MKKKKIRPPGYLVGTIILIAILVWLGIDKIGRDNVKDKLNEQRRGDDSVKFQNLSLKLDALSNNYKSETTRFSDFKKELDIEFHIMDSANRPVKRDLPQFDIKNNRFYGPSQFGNHNTQNNQFGPKQREANDSVLNIIISKVPSKQSGIWFYGRNNEDETNSYISSLIKAMKAKGYANATLGIGMLVPGDTIYLDDAEATRMAQRRFQFEHNGNVLEVIVPLR